MAHSGLALAPMWQDTGMAKQETSQNPSDPRPQPQDPNNPQPVDPNNPNDPNRPRQTEDMNDAARQALREQEEANKS